MGICSINRRHWNKLRRKPFPSSFGCLFYQVKKEAYQSIWRLTCWNRPGWHIGLIFPDSKIIWARWMFTGLQIVKTDVTIFRQLDSPLHLKLIKHLYHIPSLFLLLSSFYQHWKIAWIRHHPLSHLHRHQQKEATNG